MLCYPAMLSVILSFNISHTAFFCKMEIIFFYLAVGLKNSYSVTWLTLVTLHSQLLDLPAQDYSWQVKWAGHFHKYSVFFLIATIWRKEGTNGRKKRKEGMRQPKETSKHKGQLRPVMSTFSFPNSCIRRLIWSYII